MPTVDVQELRATERAEVARLTAQGEAGLNELRMQRVCDYVAWLAGNTQAQNPMDELTQQQLVGDVFLSLARQADRVIDRPNSQRLLEIETAMGVYDNAEVFATALKALKRLRPKTRAAEDIKRFIQAYHSLLARSLITMATEQECRKLEQSVGSTQIISGRQRHYGRENEH
ncbi:MAG TPA: hypothetical protein VN778_03850 [Verrucomicrobiae bacterium]|nr:hypothetical protein [Verrucomicrobiae bacterium]